MGDKRRVRFNLTILAVLLVATLVFLFRDCDFGEIWNILLSAKKWPIAVGAALMFLYIVFAGRSVQVLFNAMGEKMSVLRSVKYAFIEFFFSAITPSNTGGQPMQAVAMHRDGYKLSDSTAVLLAVAAIYKVSLFLLLGILYALNFTFLHARAMEMKVLFYLGLAMNVLLVVVILIALYSKKIVYTLGRFGVNLLSKVRIIKDREYALKKMQASLENYHECADFMRRHPFAVARALFWNTMQRVTLLLIPYMVYIALGLEGTSIWQVMGIQLLLAVSVDMMPLPGAMGISESVFLLLYDLVFGSALMYPGLLLSRSLSFYLFLPIAGLVVFFTYYGGPAKRAPRD